MAGQKEYDIAFVGLKPGFHDFQFEIKDKFFEAYGPQEFTNCKAIVNLKLEKNTGFMMLRFEVGGTATVLCDRCGNEIPIQLWDDFKLIVKLVDDAQSLNEREEDPDVFYLNRTDNFLHLADFIYEFVNLSVPTTHLCPPDAAGESTCNQEVLKKLQQMRPEDHNANALWKGLEKLKGLKE